VVSYGPRICYHSPDLSPGSFDVTVLIELSRQCRTKNSILVSI
jgi:hypothetical protein